MIKVEIEIINKFGIHARPAALLAKEANESNTEMIISINDEKANLKSVVDILALGVKKGSVVKLEFNGFDEDLACKKIVELVNNRFGEE